MHGSSNSYSLRWQSICVQVWSLVTFVPRTHGLIDKFVASGAVFRSAIDSWAISQVFPVMPIHRLQEVRYSSNLRHSVQIDRP